MGEALIVRRGSGTRTIAPSINLVSKTFNNITFTITNNDTQTADIFWEVGDNTPDDNLLELAGGATSNEIELNDLTPSTQYQIFAFANTSAASGSSTSIFVSTTEEAPEYVSATGGTTEEYDDDGTRYRSHTFTSDGDFVVNEISFTDTSRNDIDFLIVAGGGAGGVVDAGGGGGAGGFRTTFGTQGGLGTLDTKPTVTLTTYSITIGAGGVAYPTEATATEKRTTAPSGTSSSAFGVTSIGGGGGGSWSNGASGGSGGGAGSNGGTSRPSGGGTGTTNQGFAGGGSQGGSGAIGNNGGGGGGAGAVGGGAVLSTSSGNGGIGIQSVLKDNTNIYYAGGGGGGSNQFGRGGGEGGLGGGGYGSRYNNSIPAQSGTINTGGGGGGGDETYGPGGNGGSGIVVIRYEIAPSV
jgi:hypothetical protein